MVPSANNTHEGIHAMTQEMGIMRKWTLNNLNQKQPLKVNLFHL